MGFLSGWNDRRGIAVVRGSHVHRRADAISPHRESGEVVSNEDTSVIVSIDFYYRWSSGGICCAHRVADKIQKMNLFPADVRRLGSRRLSQIEFKSAKVFHHLLTSHSLF